MGRSLSEAWQIRIIQVFTDEGITGVLGSPMVGGLVSDIIMDYLKPVVVGEDPMNYERLWRKMFGGEAGWRPGIAKGEAVRAISVLDTIMWDIIGKKLETPVYKLLGGYRDEVPCYASGGHYVTMGSHKEEMAYIEQQMNQYIDMGFKAVKIRVGRDIDQDCERARLAREIKGPDTKLMMDFNTSQTYQGGAPHAVKFMKALEEFDPFWFEDPLVMDDIAGMKQVSDGIETPIATGENEQTIWGFRDLIVNRAVDILLPDATQMCGGITEWRKIASMADAFRMPVAAHAGDVAHVHCVASVLNGLTVEVFAPHDQNYSAYQVDPVSRPTENGLLEVPQRPGLGIQLNEDYIEKNLIR